MGNSVSHEFLTNEKENFMYIIERGGAEGEY